MSSTGESPDGGLALQSHYSLRWNNHQTHILQAFEALLHAEILVDVTLVCSESSIRAHKVVLSACSPFFERIFAEHPCKHPVIVLKDFPGREIGALIDFMYRGEVRVERDDLPSLMRAAESLQIRGLSLTIQPNTTTSTSSQIDTQSDILIDERLTPDDDVDINTQIIDEQIIDDDIISTSSINNIKKINNNKHSNLYRIKTQLNNIDDTNITQLNHINFTMRDLHESSCGSPLLLPRRKQARPRRRSGELIPQDLSRPHPPSSISPCMSNNNVNNNLSTSQIIDENNTNNKLLKSQNNNYQKNLITTTNDLLQKNQSSPLINEQCDDVAENLSMKRSQSPAQSLSLSDTTNNHHQQQQQQQQNLSHLHHHHHHHHHHSSSGIKTESESASSPRGSPLTGTSINPDNSLNDLPTASLPSISALSLTPPHHHSEYLTSLGQLAAHWLPNNPQNPAHLHHHPHSHHQQSQQQQQQQQRDESPQGHGRNLNPFQQESSSRRSIGVFSIDQMSPLSSSGQLFSHSSGIDRTSLLADLHDSFKPETLHGLFGGNIVGHHITTKKSKKQQQRDNETARRWSEHGRGMPIGRPKGQHSAPRGGPPRSWTNAELTEALQHVWNKKMTTSQASRMFGIPYNSLLMYVRGKYGKSLKLEQLRRDCTGTTANDVINNIKLQQQQQQQQQQQTTSTTLSHTIAGLTTHHDEQTYSHHSLLNSNLTNNFFPDFINTSYPVPVSMVHLLPPSEQKTYDNLNCTGPPGTSDIQSRSPSPLPTNNNNHDIIPQSAQLPPALLQQNGAE